MTRLRSPFRFAFRGLFVLVFAAQAVHAQRSTVAEQIATDRALLAKETYVTPAPEIAQLVTAPRWLNVTLTMQSPDRTHFLREESDGLPTVTEFGKFHYYFGGLQVDPKANRARPLTTRASAGLSLIDAATGKTTTVQVPKGATVSSPAWSPDGKQLAYIANFDAASQIYVADVATGTSVLVTRTPLLATLVTSIDWTADGSSVIAVFVPDSRGPEPKAPAVATGPEVRLWLHGVKEPERNWASLLQGPYEKALMTYYVTGQLGVVNVKTHALQKVGAPAMISAVDAGPDARYFRVTTMQEPFSYVVQYNSFGTVRQIWDATGRVLAEIDTQPSREGQVPDTAGGGFGGRGGRDGAYRGLSWMPQGAGMYYIAGETPAARATGDSADAAPAGRSGRGGRGGAAARHDRVMRWMPPFGKGDTSVVYAAAGQLTSVVFSDDAKTLFAADNTNGTGEIYAVNLDAPQTKHTIVRQRGYVPSFAGVGPGGRGGFGGRGGAANDSAAFYSNPGAMMTERGTRGVDVALVSSDAKRVYLTGTRYHPDYLANPPQAFVDAYDISTGEKAPVFLAATDASESVAAPLDDDFNRAVVTRESRTEVADAYVWERATGKRTKLTANEDRAPAFTALVRKRIVVTRPDGFQFVVRLTLPSNYKDGTRLPGMFWFYPYEYTSQAEYDRTLRTEDVNKQPVAGPRTIEYLATQGYAVANFDPPIVGEAGRMNDNYVHDLVMDLSTVIDALDKAGYIDRARLGIGGHSYGAFSTMNALAHTPFFKAGIAGDGMYNRTLTPDGFQNERRTFWTGQKTYEEMSSFFYADKIEGAVLMYHSMEDQNVGTDPISSIRMMQALRALGKTAALFMYPYEDHGPLMRETVLDQWTRWTAWLDMYVKHAGEWKAGADDRISTLAAPQPNRR
ncbi:MAG TPA: prolyl oligopeptidase family serine peptidase [Gemmatimonadaceae bacterium]|nr:prolyl oligopeptidase family serine peptidase [Gemmatimonadaceae bacterium]